MNVENDSESSTDEKNSLHNYNTVQRQFTTDFVFTFILSRANLVSNLFSLFILPSFEWLSHTADVQSIFQVTVHSICSD